MVEVVLQKFCAHPKALLLSEREVDVRVKTVREQRGIRLPAFPGPIVFQSIVFPRLELNAVQVEFLDDVVYLIRIGIKCGERTPWQNQRLIQLIK